MTMKAVEVKLHSIRSEARTSATVVVERRRGDTWHREEAYNMVTGDNSESRRILLDNGQRLVIEGDTMETPDIVWDRDQNAAVRADRPLSDEERAFLDKQNDLQDARDKKLAEQRRGEEINRPLTEEERRAVTQPAPYTKEDENSRPLSDVPSVSEPADGANMPKETGKPSDANNNQSPRGLTQSTPPKAPAPGVRTPDAPNRMTSPQTDPKGPSAGPQGSPTPSKR